MRVHALRVEADGAVLRIALARPERRNAFDAELIAELTSAFADVGDVRAVVLSGDGPSFSAGADVEWMRSSIDLSYDDNVDDALRLRAMLDAIDGCPAPVIGRVQGHALGGGCGLVACCDVVVADPAAVFAFSEVKLGIVPAVISPFALAKIGPSAARRYFVTGERFDADTALRIGLVHEVTPDLDKAVERVAAELLTAGPRAASLSARSSLVLRTADEEVRSRGCGSGSRPSRAWVRRIPASPMRSRLEDASRSPRSAAICAARTSWAATGSSTTVRGKLGVPGTAPSSAAIPATRPTDG